jgi:uncharacterized protein (TIGR02646 family)
LKRIQKGAEPASLLRYRKLAGATYGNLPARVVQDIREALVEEQGAVCCYCMRRIHPTAKDMKIEHWQPQSTSPDLQLTWANLLGACMGGEGSAPEFQHCDTKKGSTILTLNPTRERCELVIKYLATGDIAVDEPFRTDLLETLQLNVAVLVNCRRGVLNAVTSGLVSKYGAMHTWTRSQLEKEMEVWSARHQGMFAPCCQVAIYWLKKRTGSVTQQPLSD